MGRFVWNIHELLVHVVGMVSGCSILLNVNLDLCLSVLTDDMGVCVCINQNLEVDAFSVES